MRLLHGSLMVFFVLTAAPQLGFGNFLLPLQIGAKEMAFPSLNRFSFWMTVASLAGMTASFFLPLNQGSICGSRAPPFFRWPRCSAR